MVAARTAARTAAHPKLLFLVTEDWYFWSHRLPVARAARDAGFDVVVATRVGVHGERIRAEGFRLCPLAWRRRGDGRTGRGGGVPALPPRVAAARRRADLREGGGRRNHPPLPRRTAGHRASRRAEAGV